MYVLKHTTALCLSNGSWKPGDSLMHGCYNAIGLWFIEGGHVSSRPIFAPLEADLSTQERNGTPLVPSLSNVKRNGNLFFK